MATLPFSHTLRSIMLPLLWIVSVALFIGISYELSDKGLVPHWLALPHLPPTGAIPACVKLYCNHACCRITLKCLAMFVLCDVIDNDSTDISALSTL